jgi:hypothetical protein
MADKKDHRRRLGDEMERRRIQLGLRWKQVAEDGGISYESIRAVRHGDADLRELTKRGIDVGLRWEPGSVQIILDGGDPVPVPEPDEGAEPASPRIPWAESDEPGLDAYEFQVRNEVDAATDKHRKYWRDLKGAEIFADSDAQALMWDLPSIAGWSLAQKVRLIGKVRLEIARTNRERRTG